MSGFETSSPTSSSACSRLRYLVVADVDLPSATRVAEHFITKVQSHSVGGDSKTGHGIDGIIMCGPLVTQRNWNCSTNKGNNRSETGQSIERTAAATGDVSATIAMFENISCRVLYVPHCVDPILHFPTDTSASASASAPAPPLAGVYHMTPNALNIDGCVMPLTASLQVGGFCERPRDEDADEEEDEGQGQGQEQEEEDEEGVGAGDSDRMDDILCEGGGDGGGKGLSFIKNTTAAPVKTLLKALASSHSTAAPAQAQAQARAPSSSMVVLNYHYASTLNQLLFCLPQEVKKARVRVCIIPTLGDVESLTGVSGGDSAESAPKSSSVRLPHSSTIDGVTIVSPESLRSTGKVTLMELVEGAGAGAGAGAGWTVQSLQQLVIPTNRP